MNKTKPNVILVLTDDQGYGDLGCTGNPWIQTPHIDSFYDESIRCSDFHVSPLCTPTRGAIMSGHRPVRNGAWATCWGRSILRKDEVTMADIFKDSGYATGMFGKWHLGDNYPYRPQDRGFDRVVAHKGGGVGQSPDFWGNNYFNDTYFHNSEPREHTGYCTDIWFEEALTFIEEKQDQPFFAYIATNAPHAPYLVDKKYTDLYRGNPDIPEPAFYGMITNIDENFGRLDAKLHELGIAENTILIFMTDNGSSGGCNLDADGFVQEGYNAGMRGKKASYYEGGHRVPFFIRWSGGGIEGGRDLTEMTLHLDMIPTFIELCGLKPPGCVSFDGMSFAGLLKGEETGLPDRTQFLQIRQSTDPPEQWTNVVMTPRWRLVHGRELYDIRADPGQKRDISSQYHEIVEKLRTEHEQWWAEIEPGLHEYCPISLGNDHENPTRLDAMDVMGDVAWQQPHIVRARKTTGKWAVDIEQPGTYRFSLKRWPDELGLPVDGCISDRDAQQLALARSEETCSRLEPISARLKLFDIEQTVPVEKGDRAAEFTLELTQAGETRLEAWFIDEDGTETGAYYVYAERLKDNEVKP